MNKLIIISGAGISAPSGIKTFRDNDGLWENHQLSEVCNIDNWKKNIDKVHNFYNERRIQLKYIKPNKIHYKIKEWQDIYGLLY